MSNNQDNESPVEILGTFGAGVTSVVQQTTEIWVTWALHGVHKYPNAPEEVGYLRNAHRHLFKFKVNVSVTHDDREVEFHMLQNWCKDQYASGVLELDYKSCEMLARELLDKLTAKYGAWRSYMVEVSEDGECGAILTQKPAR